MVATQRQSSASTIPEPGACSIAERRRLPGAVSRRTVIESALAGCGKTEQGSRSDSDPFTSGFGYVHGQNEFFRSLLARLSNSSEIVLKDMGLLPSLVILADERPRYRGG